MIENHVRAFNTNSYISVGIMVLIISACVWLNNKFGELKQAQMDVGYRMATVEGKFDLLQKVNITDRWTNVDMFKWAVHLQQNNPQLKVPEPKPAAE